MSSAANIAYWVFDEKADYSLDSPIGFQTFAGWMPSYVLGF
jgi:hypothetical protein